MSARTASTGGAGSSTRQGRSSSTPASTSEAASALRDTEPPAYVSVVGKPRTYETEDGTVNVSLRPENITVVDDATRDRWVVETAERTLDRIEAFGEWEAEQEAPESGSTAPTNEYAEMVRDRYDSPVENYRRDVIQALEQLETVEDTEAAPQ